jgi:DNA repair exonuclease SbcCD ATPase subunit
MISNLTYRISFPSTGKAFSQNINFAPGLTIIRGANETGKSLILEMIRYALFGVAALRGDRSDYEVLDVNLVFNIKDEAYRIVRTGNKAYINGKLAVGTTAVNNKVIELLGFGLDVFDIACAAVQGDLDKLTKRMRPGERRKMVEEVIGLNSIEEQEKACRSEGNALKKLADAQQAQLVEPEPPEIPDNYESSSILEELYKRQIKIEAEREQLLRIEKPEPPIVPIKPEYKEDVIDYESNRLKIEQERTVLEKTLQGIPTATRTRQDTEQALLYYEQKLLGPRPRFPKSDLERWKNDWQTINSAGDLVRCPVCDAEFNPKTNILHTLPEEPPITLREIDSEFVAHARWDNYNKPIIETTDLTEEEANAELIALSQETHRNQLLDTLGALPNLPSREKEAERYRLYLKQLDRYNWLYSNWQDHQRRWEDSQNRLASLPKPDITLEDKLKKSREYEEQKRRFDANISVHKEALASIELVRRNSEGYFNGANALKDVRLEAKQHLVPSLNKVASHLLSEMTDGKRNRIVVDEEFEVTVDGQPVRTLSGSGISVVNLALRIALGQVLTQKMVPLFLADEIDQDMDPERAAATHTSLKKLSKLLDKVVVVTHKDIEGDHIIHLE